MKEKLYVGAYTHLRVCTELFCCLVEANIHLHTSAIYLIFQRKFWVRCNSHAITKGMHLISMHLERYILILWDFCPWIKKHLQEQTPTWPVMTFIPFLDLFWFFRTFPTTCTCSWCFFPRPPSPCDTRHKVLFSESNTIMWPSKPSFPSQVGLSNT